MGSGDRIKFTATEFFGLGFSVGRFPFAVTVYINLAFWSLTVGFGKGYDQ